MENHEVVSGWMFDRYHVSDSCGTLVGCIGDVFKHACAKSLVDAAPVAIFADRYVDMYREDIIDWSWDSFRGVPETVPSATMTEYFCTYLVPKLNQYLQRAARGTHTVSVTAKNVAESSQALIWVHMQEGRQSMIWRN